MTDTQVLPCPECEQETTQEICDVKDDGSGFTDCQTCDKIVVHMAGTFN